MGTTSISANLDDKVIYCYYYRDIDVGESASAVDLSVTIKHQYVTSTNIAQEIVLEQFVIPKEYLQTTGLLGVSPVEQTIEFHILNLRYLDNIFVEIQEVREGNPILTRVPILNGDEDQVNGDLLPNNPERYPEQDENIPEVVPDRNISIERTDIGVLYSIEETALESSQISRRIYLQEANGEQTFIQQDYNQKSDRIFIENSIDNLLPNPQFLGTGNIPTSWEIDAPGITLNSFLSSGSIDSTNIWRIRASNPNVFSAFNSVTLKTTDIQNLYTGLAALTFSIYYNVQSDIIPFNNFIARFNFYFNTDFIRTEEVPCAVSEDLDVYRLLVCELQGSQIPIAANKFSFELVIAEIDSTDLFDIEFYLPQVEASSYATTRALDSRIEDRYVTGAVFELNLPFYIWLQTYHITGPGIRGIFSSTTNQVNGLEFSSSNDCLRFKWYDSSGNILLNIASAVIPPSIHVNNVVQYGVMVTATTLDFYINGTLLSSHTNTVVIDQNQYYIVGSLEKSNTTLNSELLDFKILRSAV